MSINKLLFILLPLITFFNNTSEVTLLSENHNIY